VRRQPQPARRQQRVKAATGTLDLDGQSHALDLYIYQGANLLIERQGREALVEVGRLLDLMLSAAT